MKKIKYCIPCLMLFFIMSCKTDGPDTELFEPTFESLEKANPVPEWFKDAKFGIYFHWGVYSVPAYGNEWYPRNMYMNGSNEYKHHLEVYGDPKQWPYNNFIDGGEDRNGNFVQFAPKLKSEGGAFDPNEWAQLFADAGAKFAGPVAEHHDGFSMWASKVNPWNAKDKGPQLDLVGLLAGAIRKQNMKLILSMHHAFNITGFYEAAPQAVDSLLQILYGQMGKEKNEAMWLEKHKEIIDFYQPDIIWQDFNLHVISQSVLLNFLSYYYNKANEWNKEVVATYKDGLNTKCAVLDYERGGAKNITPYYWLTDDAISSTSWCHTKGLEYYSKKQILHGFIDRISKNGNLLLNISPEANGSIPQEQKDILLTMGDWLKKYGEAIYTTRAWEIYGEGPTKMGSDHGVFTAPAEGTSKDVRFTRSKDNTILYAILLDWQKDQKDILIQSLSSERLSLKNLKSIELLTGKSGEYQSLTYNQSKEGLSVDLPEKKVNDLAYVLKISFDGTIPKPDKSVEIDCNPNYYIVPSGYPKIDVLGSEMVLTKNRKDQGNQWKFEAQEKGFYRIINRANSNKCLTYLKSAESEYQVILSDISGKENELWKIEDAYFGYKISNKEYPDNYISLSKGIQEGDKVILTGDNLPFEWDLKPVCELKQKPFKPNRIPGTIEAEDFDSGCLGEAYFERDEINSGGKYRQDEFVDIDTCYAGGYAIGWTNNGEWLAYTLDVEKSASYKIRIYVAAPSDQAKIHLELSDENKTEVINLPATAGYQNWEVVETQIDLKAGTQVLKLVVDNNGFNIDKMIFQKL